MRFAQFQSTYKPLPISTYERTGSELEAKYYRNREQSSLLRQGLANTKVEDRNIGHLAKAVTDVEGILDEVNGKWHYASNALYKAKDRLVNDKVLGASIEDYAKSQATKQNEQKRLEEGKIGQNALNAFYTYDKLYNNKAIELDEHGQLKNRWSTPIAPEKVDEDKMAMEIVKTMLDHPDSYDSSLTPILDKLGMPTGYLERINIKEVKPEKLFSEVKGMLMSSNAVKDYYNYINRADLLSKTTVLDENGNAIEKSILPTMISEYRNMGWNVDEKGNLLDNYQHYINDRGEFDILKDKDKKSVEILNAPKNIFDDPTLKYYINEQKLTAEDALKTTYLNRKLDSQLNSIADGYKRFAYSNINHTDTTADQEYWVRAKFGIEKEMENMIAYHDINKAPVRNEKYNIFDATRTAEELRRNLFSITNKNSEEYNNTRKQLNTITNNIKLTSKAFYNSTEGKVLLDSLWKDIIKDTSFSEGMELTTKYKEDFKNFLLGEGDIPEILAKGESKTKSPISEQTGRLISSISRTPFTAGMQSNGKGTFREYKLENAKQQFLNAVQNKLKTGLAIDNNYIRFKDINGNTSPFHKTEGEYIKENGQSWIVTDNTGEIGKPLKLQDLFKEQFGDKYNINWFDAEYFPLENTGSGYGEGVLQLTPNKNFPSGTSIPELNPITIRPDASISDDVLANRAQFIFDNSKSEPFVQKWAGTARTMSMYGKAFAPVFNAFATTMKAGEIAEGVPAQDIMYGNYLYDVDVKTFLENGSKKYGIYLTPESVKKQGASYPTIIPMGVGDSLQDAISDLAIKSFEAKAIEDKSRSTK